VTPERVLSEYNEDLISFGGAYLVGFGQKHLDLGKFD